MKRQAHMLLLAWLLAVPASAATICVKPTGSTTATGNPCYATLGYALTGTSPQVAAGDVISVAAGVYKETAIVTIGATLTGLHIVGPSSAIIDNEISTGNIANMIQVDAASVLIQGLTLRNGRNQGISVSSTADGFTLSGTTFNGIKSSCLEIYGDDAIVKLAKFYGCGNNGIAFLGKNISVTSSVFKNVGCDALYGLAPDHDFGTVTFSHNQVYQSYCAPVYFQTDFSTTVSPGVQSAVIQSNTISNIYSYGIYVNNAAPNDAGTAIVTGNKIANTDNAAIYLVNMDANVVTANSIKYVYESQGVYIQGGGAHQILSNSIAGTRDSGIFLGHANTGNEPDGTVIKLNKITDAIYDPAIYAYYGKGMTVSNNTVSNTYSGIELESTDTPTVFANTVSNVTYNGIYVHCSDAVGTADSCTGATINSNRITGTQDDPGIYLDADSGTPAAAIQINTNIVKNATDHGLELFGDGMTLSKNQVLNCGGGNGQAGVYVSGNGATLTSNISRYNSGDGFYVSGSGATFTSNLADHNSEDGFDLHASTTGTASLNTNHATFNAGTGFEIDSSDTVATTGSLNTAASNGLNSCNAGTGTTVLINGAAPTAFSGSGCDEGSGYIGD